MTIEAVKIKLGSHCGTAASDMVLQLKDGTGALVAALSDPQRKLGFFSPQDGCAIGIYPQNPAESTP
jgi:tubulin-folding cofactor B